MQTFSYLVIVVFRSSFLIMLGIIKNEHICVTCFVLLHLYQDGLNMVLSSKTNDIMWSFVLLLYGDINNALFRQLCRAL